MLCWASGPSSPWEELPMQTSALPSHLRDQDQLIHCLSDSFTLFPYSNTPDAQLKVSLSWNTFQICSSALVSPPLEHSAINQPPMSHSLTIDTWRVLVPFHMENGQMAFKFYHSCLSKKIHHTHFFELGVITLPTPSHLELMCVIRNLIVLVSVSSFLSSTFASLFYNFVLNIH